jgi:hypothetical protein
MAQLIPSLVSTTGPSVLGGEGLGDGTNAGGGFLGRSSGALRTYINGFPISLLFPSVIPPHSDTGAETPCAALLIPHCAVKYGGATFPAEGTVGLFVESSPVHLNGHKRGCWSLDHPHVTVVTTQMSVWVGLPVPPVE